jgi:hypothetical protein
VDVAVRFFADLVHGAGDRNARVQDLQPTGVVDVLPETLITLYRGCLWGSLGPGSLRRVREPISNEERTTPNEYTQCYCSCLSHAWEKLSLARHSRRGAKRRMRPWLLGIRTSEIQVHGVGRSVASQAADHSGVHDDQELDATRQVGSDSSRTRPHPSRASSPRQIADRDYATVFFHTEQG